MNKWRWPKVVVEHDQIFFTWMNLKSIYTFRIFIRFPFTCFNTMEINLGKYIVQKLMLFWILPSVEMRWDGLNVLLITFYMIMMNIFTISYSIIWHFLKMKSVSSTINLLKVRILKEANLQFVQEKYLESKLSFDQIKDNEF